ncbi:MAG: hypothetical protein JSW34_02590, partial [Candidatus Zixiibacteriota bacterium]
MVGLFLFVTTVLCFAQIDVMFYDDFENLNAGDTPDKFMPSGSANPDWDNILLDPLNSGVDANEIDATVVGGNPTKKYRLDPTGAAKPVLLGASFNPSSERFVVVEYDMLTTGMNVKDPTGEVYYTDGYGNIDGTGGSTKLAIHIQFNDDDAIPDDDNGKNNYFYRTTGQDNDVTTYDGNEWTTGITWSVGRWYRIQVVADQQNKTFDLKITDKSTGTSDSLQGLPFNDSNAGYIRKVWFGTTMNSGNGSYFDNIFVYQGSTAPPVQGPTIIFQEYSRGPVNSNTGLNVDFSDDIDLVSIQYKIGTSGLWKDLTSDGTNTFNLTGGADTSVTALVYITDADFAAMSEGENQIYFRAEDNAAQVTESDAYLSYYKDTQVPNTARVDVPNSTTIPALTSIEGEVRDAVSGIAANTATFTLQRQDNLQYWNGSAWQVGAAPLPSTHAGTTDGSASNWINSGGLPPLTGVAITARISVDDNLGNGPYTGAPVTFTVIPGVPRITMNMSSVGPARNNAFAPIDVDFSDDTDLQSTQYKIGAAGAWTELTSDGIAPFNLTGPADTSVTALGYIRNTDFAALPEGKSDIYFRAIDDLANINETVVALQFWKDTIAPTVATVGAPSSDPFSSLPTVAGQIGDAAAGGGFKANLATFSIQRSGDGAYWTGSGWGALTQLPTTHLGTTDDTAVNWVKNATVPTLANLTNGETYTFAITITDRAGNTASSSYSFLFDDVPEVASVTSPANGSVVSSPFGVSGQAADHEGGVGLAANSTTFTLIRAADGFYWNGTGWQAGTASLATTHPATSGSNQVSWTAAATLPGAGDLSDGDYLLRATATNLNAGSYTGAQVTVTYDGGSPTILSGTMATTNAYLTLLFSEKVWGDNAQTTAIQPTEFTVTFQQNGGGLTSAAVSGFYADSFLTTPLSAATGYSMVYAQLSNTGGPATGVETITVTANAASIYDLG